MIKKIFAFVFCLTFSLYASVLPQTGNENMPAPQQTAAQAPKVEVEETPNEVTIEEDEEGGLKPGYVTVNFKGADIRAVLNYLSDVGSVDIVPAPDVAGVVTLKLTNKPWETALDIIVRNYGFAYEREGGIIRVVTIDSLKMEELSTEIMKLNYAKAEEILPTIEDMLSERGKIKADARTNAVVITDIPTYIYKIKQVITRLDKKTPQIMIEAKILETTLGKDERMGIDWNIKVSATGAKRPITAPFYVSGVLPGIPGYVSDWMPRGLPSSTNSTAGTALGSTTVTTETDAEFPSDWTAPFPYVDADQFTFGTLDFSQFSIVLEYIKSRSDTDVVSNPRITTLNNKSAKIMVGRVYNFPTFSQAEETGRWVISGYQSKDLGIKLLVTPNVNENGEIVVKLKPEISNYLGQEKMTEELSAPLWSTREAETEVMVRDGDTIFIGGLIRENDVEVEDRFPILGDLFGDVPILEYILKHKTTRKEKTELIFFITVHIVKDTRELAKAAKLPSEVYVQMGKDGEKLIPLLERKEIPQPKAKPKSWFDVRKDLRSRKTIDVAESKEEKIIEPKKEKAVKTKKKAAPWFDARKKK